MAHLDSRADEHATAYSYPVSHCNTVADEHATTYGYPVSHCNTVPHAYAGAHADTHSDPATRDSLRLHQRRGEPHLRDEERRLRRLLGPK